MGIFDINNADMSWEEALISLGFGHGTKFGTYLGSQWMLNQTFPGVVDFNMYDKTLSGELYIKEKPHVEVESFNDSIESFTYTINTPTELISIVNMLKGKVES